MDKEKYSDIKADTPLSITDAAPAVIKLDCGVAVRIPSFGDHRIRARIEHDVKECDEIDSGVIMLYCAMHTTRKQVGELWRMSRNPAKMYDKIMTWQMAQSAENIGRAITELSDFICEHNDQADLDGDPEPTAKKKTGSR